MDFLNKTYSQLADLFRSMTPGARITAGLLLAVVVISLVYMFQYQASGPSTDLMNGVPVPANCLAEMEAAFARAGLNSYELRGTRIYVPRDKKAAYMAALADANALPPNIEDVFQDVLENDGPFTNPKASAQRMKIAREKQMSMIIGLMSDIEAAYVTYDTQTTSGLHREKVGTASVSVKARGSEYLDEGQVTAIRNLVSASVAGLKPEDVKVTDLNAGRSYVFDPEHGGPESNHYAQLKKDYERTYREKVRNLLSFIENLTVEPNVVLSRERVSRTTSVKYDAKPVAVKESDQSSSTSTQSAGPAGRVGYSANAAANTGASLASSSRGSQEETEESKREVVSVPNAEQKQVEGVGPTPTAVSVSIGIPSSYFEKVWKERNPPAEGQEAQTPDASELQTIRDEETTGIKEVVANMLITEGVTGGATVPTELVKVKVFQDIQHPAIPGPSLAKETMLWFGQYWGTLAMVGLAVVSLGMLRSMVRAAPLESPAAAAGRPAGEAAAESEEPVETAVLNRLGRFKGGGRSLRDELSELVQEDTDAAANILKTWISNAS